MKQERNISWLALVLGLIVAGLALLGLRDGEADLPLIKDAVTISGWAAQLLNIGLLLFGLLLLYAFICSLRKVEKSEPDRTR